MKKLTFLLVLLALFISNSNAQETTKIAVLSGTIHNPQEKFVIVSHKEVVKIIRDTAMLDSVGYFSIDVELEKSAYYTFTHSRERTTIFLSPGDKLKLSLTTDEFDETLKYKGEGALINNYLAKSFMLDESIKFNYRKTYKLEELEFTAKIDSIYKVLNDNFKKFIGDNQGLDDYFVNMERNKHLYNWALQLNNYPSRHTYYTKNDTFKVSNKYYDFYNALNFNDNSLINLAEYISFLSSVVNTKADKIYKSDLSLQKQSSGYNQAKLKVIEKEFTAPKIKELLLYFLLTQQVKYYGVDGVDKMLEVYKKYCTNKGNIIKLEEEIAKWDKIAPGKIAPLFTYPDKEGNMVSLADFKGKYVYIDVWATWCSPCRKEIPFLKELEKEFHGKNVVFMSVSVDKLADKEKWLKMLEAQEMSGIQLLADKAWKSSIAKDYIVKSIPRFILIDKEGKIFTSHAVRPSGKIKEVLEGLEGL